MYSLDSRLEASYREVADLRNTSNFPSKREVAEICEDLLRLVFPGFYDSAPSVMAVYPDDPLFDAPYIETAYSHIAAQIARCGISEASHVAREFLTCLTDVRRVLSTDVAAAYEGDPAAMSFAEIILAYPCIEAIAIQRLAHCLYNKDVPLLPRMMTEWAHARTGIDIHPGAQIGESFFIDHGTGVVIGETTVIGKCVKLYHGVTLGARSFAKDEQGRIVKGGKRHPNIEDDVTIYPNATILGGETTIGMHSTIGANVFLMQSVEPYTLVTYDDKTALKFTAKHRENV